MNLLIRKVKYEFHKYRNLTIKTALITAFFHTFYDLLTGKNIATPEKGRQESPNCT